MFQPQPSESGDNRKPYNPFQSNGRQIYKLSTERSINDPVLCASINQMNKKPSGRSWTRSKRISLGCLEWRSRGPIHQTVVGPSNLLNYINPNGSHNCFVQNEDFTCICQESSKTKCKSGADSLLQRLRKRSFSRDKSKHADKMQYYRSSSAPRSVYSHENSTELQINHVNTYSLTQINKCDNLSAENLVPQISLSRSVPEFKDHNFFKPQGYLCNTKPHKCNLVSSELLSKSSYLTCSSIKLLTSNKDHTVNNNPMDLPRMINASHTLPTKNKTSANPESDLQVNCQICVSANTLHDNNMHSSITESLTTSAMVMMVMTSSSYLGFNAEYVDTPNAMKHSESFVLLDKDKQQQCALPLNPLTSSTYSEVCPRCCCAPDNNNHSRNTMNDNGAYLQDNLFSYSYEMEHSPVCEPSELINGCVSYLDAVKFNEKFANNNQLITLNTPPTTISNSISNHPNISTDHILNKDNNINHNNITDLCQTQHNSSCNSLRPDSLLSTSTTTTRESSCSDLSPNSISSHDSAIGGGKFQPDIGLLKTICSCTLTTSSTTNCMKNVEHLKYMKSSDIPVCLNNNHLNSNDVYPVPPSCLPPSGNYCCSHTPPTPIRRPWLNDNSEQMVTGRSRSSGQKRSVYVNASIYPIPEMMRNHDSNGNIRSGHVRGRQNSVDTATTPSCTNSVNASTEDAITTISNHTSDKSALSNASTVSVPYWTHLLPYRTSTVPQNLSGRLRKSETLPNDWINQESSKIGEQEIHSVHKSTSYQLNMLSHNHNSQCLNHSDECKSRSSYVNYTPNHRTHNVTDNNNINIIKEARSPPPRPPIRTSSHVVPHQNIVPSSSQSTSPYCHHRHCRIHFSKNNTSGESSNNILKEDSTDNSINESPILCRYSQLYSLNTEAKNLNSNHHNHSHSNNTATNNMTSSNYPVIHTSNHKNILSLHPRQYILYEQRFPQQPQSSTHQHHHPIQYQQYQLLQSSNNRSNYKQLVELDMKKAGN
ncbi:hypothetical protein MN116_001120 [Schistosoma mekongi]|uniref:Uncharacterized protein n=1 Tax=Schistosoma mekongi TaxID=38744 RepID=A0AAE1ZLH1_SCHME|nr:hypothetical protein MN116_001120 [Schistosoma mekongi]